ncbi:MAG: VCBS repeat-containing protein [Kiritimatiellae bacterium]|nr:VCBS repeat-containing protein [Kiritimatiellia bacterium]
MNSRSLACLLIVFSTLWVARAAPPAVAWRHLSSRRGELPLPNGGPEQTACVTADFNGDGAADIVIAERTRAPSVIGIRWNGSGWDRFVIDDTARPVEAGGAAADLDGDADLDLVLGGDWRSDEVVWYENPGAGAPPQQRWARRILKRGGAKGHHDQVAADLLGAGRPQVIFWNQGSRRLFLAEPPPDPRTAGPWPLRELFDASTTPLTVKPEGLATADVDGDGRIDLLGGVWWFHADGAGRLRPVRIADQPGRIRAGRFRPGPIAQIVAAPGDGDGPLLFIECDGDPLDPASWRRRALLDGRTVIHGHTLDIADINGDGHLDILCAEMAKWNIRRSEPDHPNATAWILYGDGQGGFFTTVLSSGIGFHEGRIADVNGDGRPDIVNKPFNFDTPRLDIWLNLGSPPSQPPR